MKKAINQILNNVMLCKNYTELTRGVNVLHGDLFVLRH